MPTHDRIVDEDGYTLGFRPIYDSGSIWSADHEFNPFLMALAEVDMAAAWFRGSLDKLGKIVENPPTDNLHTIDDRAEAYAQGWII